MESSAPSPTTSSSQLMSFLENPRTFRVFALAMGLGLAGVIFWAWQFNIKPARATAEVRQQAQLGMMRLHELQRVYRAAHGTYANDLDTLLASAPDGAQLREKLKTSIDINTLAVIGDARLYRIEINILDANRTPVKFRGLYPGPNPPEIERLPPNKSKGPDLKLKIGTLLGLVVLAMGVCAWQLSRRPKSA